MGSLSSRLVSPTTFRRYRKAFPSFLSFFPSGLDRLRSWMNPMVIFSPALLFRSVCSLFFASSPAVSQGMEAP